MRISDWSSDVCSSDLKCPNGNLKFQTDAETISAVQVGAIRPEMLNGWIGCCQGPACAGWQASFPCTEDESGKLVVGVFREGGDRRAKGSERLDHPSARRDARQLHSFRRMADCVSPRYRITSRDRKHWIYRIYFRLTPA